jgi:hypothetical protein
MKIRIQCTANLGDFMNGIPVISGLVNSYGKVDFVIRSDMRKFNGIKDFLMYQDLFTDVNFEDDVILYGDYIDLSSWTREDKNDPNRPIETCRYENWLRDHYNLDFQVDDSFELKVKELDISVDQSKSYCGDRWNGPGIDGRRASWTLAHLEDLIFLDYNTDLMTNAYIIKNSLKPFISTFTGISGIADLLNKEQIVLWGEDIRNWDNKPIEYSFEKHFYGNRKSKLMYLGDFEVSKIDQYYPV